MKKTMLPIILFIMIVLTNISAYGQDIIPEHTTEFYVNDFGDVIDELVEEKIINVNRNYENTEEKPQIVIATIPNLAGMDENLYAVKLFEKWKIGNKGFDNGILVLLSIEERRIKIEVGYGLEGAITDAEAGRILDTSLNMLSEGNYSEGLENIFFQIAIKVNEEYGYDDEEIFSGIDVNIQENTNNSASGRSIVRIVVMIILLIIINGGFGGPGRRKGRRNIIPFILPRLGGFGSGGFGGGSFGGGGRSGGGGAGRGF